MANISIKNGSYNNINNLTKDGDIGFARLGDDATLVWKDGSTLRKILPPPGDTNSSDKPLVSTGSTTPPQYKTLPISGGGTGSTSSLEAIKNLNIKTVAYATCETAAGTADKIVKIADSQWILSVGAMVAIKFSNTNTAQNPRFSVNGNAFYPVKYGTANLSTSSLSYAGYKNRVLNYIYDGSSFVFIGQSYVPTYSNASLGQGYGSCSTEATTLTKVATVSSYSLSTGGIVAIEFANKVPANSTLNISNKGAKPIYYDGSPIVDNIIQAGDIATFIYTGSYYYLIAIDRWQKDIETLQSTIRAMESSITTLGQNRTQVKIITWDDADL